MKKNIIILLIVLFIFLFSLWFNFVSAASCQKPEDCGKGERCEKGECKRMLELVYPSFGIEDKYVPKTVGVGLPEYVLYIFRFSIGIVGFVIFAALIYAGVDYLFFCAGNPKKLMEALDRLKSAGIGALILLCSYLIFNTINPQLITLELEKMTSLPGIITPGVYICNYEYKGTGEDELGTILTKYINETDEEKQIEAVKKLKNVIINPKNKEETCKKLNFSDNFEGFTVDKNKTMFMVPALEVDPNNYKKRIAKYEYGIILHEKDNFRGRCIVQPYAGDRVYKENFESFQLGDALDFNTAKSVTLFKKPSMSPSAPEGVTLYSCYNFNKSVNFCPKNITTTEEVFKPKDDFVNTYIEEAILEKKNLKENIRSVKISPKGYYFAIVWDKNVNCAILKTNDPDLTNLPSLDTGCGTGCNKVYEFIAGVKLKACTTCIRAMLVYLGQIL